MLSMLCGGLAFHASPARRSVLSATARSGMPVAMMPDELSQGIFSASVQIANIIPGGVGYGNTGSGFWDRAGGGAAGDLTQIGLLAVGFPLAVTAVFYKDNILSIFDDPTSDPDEPVPPGWKKEPSQSRPGKFAYVNTKTRERFDRLPRGSWDAESATVGANNPNSGDRNKKRGSI